MKSIYILTSGALISLYSLLVSMGADKASAAGILHVSNLMHFKSIGRKEFSLLSLFYYPLIAIGILFAIIGVIFIVFSAACDNNSEM